LFKIDTSQNKAPNDCIEIRNYNDKSYAKINLNNGGSLQELCFQNTTVIKDLSPLPYADTFASSILFPFAGRIKNGAFSYLEKSYQLPINEVGMQNALHGLVYDKTFQVIEKSTSQHRAEIILEYRQNDQIEGFPFAFSLQLCYVMTSNNMTLEIKVQNLDKMAFPFCLGWHPYFCSSNLSHSSFSVNSSKKTTFDAHLIAVGEEAYSGPDEIVIGSESFDDCFVLNDNKVGFKTPDYELSIQTSSKENYVQVYTLNEGNVVAIEPLTAAPNSFNNNKGLQFLEPSKGYSVSWNITLISKNECDKKTGLKSLKNNNLIA